MFDRDNWNEILNTLSKNKWRTALTAFGVFWGIFMLVIMMGAGNGLRNGVSRDFEGTATNSFFIWTQRTSKAYKGMQPGRNFDFTNDDAIAMRQKLPELKTVAPQNQLGDYGASNSVIRGLKSGAFPVLANYPVIQEINSIKIKQGRFINDLDITDKRKVCVIGARVVEMLFAKNDTVIGDYIRINGIYFRVVGITSPTGSGEQARESGEQIHIPFTTFQNAFSYGNRVGWFAVTSRDDVPAEKAEEKAIAFLKERHSIAPDDKMAIGHWNLGKQFNRIMGLFDIISFIVWFVGSGTLIAGVIGVSNIMLIVVKERTKEFGIKRAIGARPIQIVGQLILETIFLTSLAGYFGLAAGVGVLELVGGLIGSGEGTMFTNPEVNLQVALIALGILIVSGAFAGMIPARRAVSISPVDALRSE